MSQPAQVRSIEALAAFRTTLLVYRDRAARILDDVRDEMIRTRGWLETDRQLHWKKAVHDRSMALAQAEQELLTARLSGHNESIQERRIMVNRAKTALQDAEAGLARVRHWLRHYETEVSGHSKAVFRLHQFLAIDLQNALVFLEGAVTILSDYAAMTAEPPSASQASETAAPGVSKGGTPAAAKPQTP